MATAERDYYEVLGVARTAGDDEIKRAFRRLARELHPDVSTEPDAAERFKQVAQAYEVLSDRQRRDTYDRFGHAGLRRGGFAPTDFDLGDITDLFSAFFGEGLFGQTGRTGGRGRGADVAAAVEITLAEAYRGTEVQVPLQVAVACERCRGSGAEPGTSPVTCLTCGGAGRVQQVSQSVFGQFVRASSCPRCRGSGVVVETPCERCDGEGRLVEERTLDVEIPAGIHDGQRIRVQGEGHAGVTGGHAGDAFVQVRVRADDRLVRDGDDLVAVVGLTMVDAAIGSTVTVPTAEGEIELEIPPGVQPGDVRVLRGKGMPSLAGGRRGDLRVHLDVRIPRRLDPEQRRLLVELAEQIGEDAYRDDGEGGFFERLRSAFR
ncbi:MAG: molecular chaperone DnaJ [Actinobacteria bacterium]|nr:MAG: molecular chaperone DnaJ [Deltaproteobacteria bacterium]TMM06142.1 MAG: molecular chaperone DnaJ [Actinomycetota bacterium]